MHILHLIDGASPQACPATLALLNESRGRLGHVQERVVLMGGSGLPKAARAVGLTDVEWFGLPCRQALLGWPSLRRRQRAWGAESPDLIHCWSIGALTLATLVWPAVPRVLSVTVPPSPAALRWLRVLTGEGRQSPVLLPISASLRRVLLSSGLDEANVHVLRPGLSLGSIDANRRETLRHRWGVTSPRTKVIMLLSDPPSASDCVAGVMVAGLAEESLRDRVDGVEFRLLVYSDQLHRRRAQATCRQLGCSARIFQDPAAAYPWAVLPGCDIALALGAGGLFGGRGDKQAENLDGGGGLSLLWAMAANVPIIGEATYDISEIVEDHHSALLAKPGQPKSLAHRVVQLMGDEQLAYKLRDTARHEAYSFFSRQRYCQSLSAVYQQLLERQPVVVPPLPVTGGLRFTGRA